MTANEKKVVEQYQVHTWDLDSGWTWIGNSNIDDFDDALNILYSLNCAAGCVFRSNGSQAVMVGACPVIELNLKCI